MTDVRNGTFEPMNTSINREVIPNEGNEDPSSETNNSVVHRVTRRLRSNGEEEDDDHEDHPYNRYDCYGETEAASIKRSRFIIILEHKSASDWNDIRYVLRCDRESEHSVDGGRPSEGEEPEEPSNKGYYPYGIDGCSRERVDVVDDRRER